jgi:hypothetical protein
MMFKDSYHNRVSKFIATQKPNNVKVNDVATAAAVTAKANARRLCNCPSSEPGKVKIDVNEHVPACRFWKRSSSSRYGTKTFVIPSEIRDGCSLGIVLGEENL